MWLVLAVGAHGERLRLVSTTTTENSGLMDVLLPQFEAASGVKVDLLVTGTGQALRIGRQGDADALLVHDPEGEIAFVQAGHGTARYPVMENHFLLVGPAEDSAGIGAALSAADAFGRLKLGEVVFLSRGDDSGTHRKELRLWGETPDGDWYRETGAGMGATLNIAAELGAYTLVDLGSWAAFGNKGDLVVLFEDRAALRNPYSLIPVAGDGGSSAKIEAVEKLRVWLGSAEGRRAILEYKIHGKPVFCPIPIDLKAGLNEACELN